MSMEFPEFHDDQEMAEWFETNDVSAADLELAADVTISSGVTLRIVGGFSFMGPGGTSSSTAAPTTEGERELPLVLN